MSSGPREITPLIAKVTVERFCGTTGRLQVSEKLKHASIHIHVPDAGSLPRVVITLKTTQVAVPLRPPLKLHTACIANGSLGISLLSAATTSVSRVVPHKPITTMQVMIHDAPQDALRALVTYISHFMQTRFIQQQRPAHSAGTLPRPTHSHGVSISRSLRGAHAATEPCPPPVSHPTTSTSAMKPPAIHPTTSTLYGGTTSRHCHVQRHTAQHTHPAQSHQTQSYQTKSHHQAQSHHKAISHHQAKSHSCVSHGGPVSHHHYSKASTVNPHTACTTRTPHCTAGCTVGCTAGGQSGSVVGGGVRHVDDDGEVSSTPVGGERGGGVGGGEGLPPLTEEQEAVVCAVRAGVSIFFTGCAGTGKSLVLKHVIAALPAATTFFTAPTGLAASALGGTTINAFAGIGRGEGDLHSLTRAASRMDPLLRWRACRVLIIDEVSMLDGRMFDTLESIARSVRNSQAPFGGIQLVLCGDFHQLPPVAKGREGMAARRFLFEASCWGRCVEKVVVLTRVFRQQGSSDFIKILNSVRDGSCTDAMLAFLQARCGRELDVSDGVLPVKLFTHRADVDALNKAQLEELPGDPVVFRAQDEGQLDVLRTGCPASQLLNLKVGAQVMLLVNMSMKKGLVNGARGVVVKFVGNSQLPMVRFVSGVCMTISRERWTIRAGGQVLASRVQVPLELAWALSVHKSQGLTLDKAELKLDAAFETGMVYVALSRVRSLQGLRIVGAINHASIQAHPNVLEFYKRVQAGVVAENDEQKENVAENAVAESRAK